MKENSKLLITGANGFIGKHLTALLKSKNIDFISLNENQVDIRDTEKLLTYFTGEENISKVIHLAGIMKSESSEEIYSINTEGTRNILKLCKKLNCGIIFMSSATVYGKPSELPLKETSITNPVTDYGKSKLQGEEMCKEFYSNTKKDCTILRLFNSYGKNQGQGLVIPTIINQVLTKDKIKLYNGDSKRDFIHVEDVVNAIYQSIYLNEFNILNIGSGKSYEISEIVEVIRKITKKNFEVDYLSIDNPVKNIYSDISKAKKLLSWEPQISIEEGLKKTIL